MLSKCCNANIHQKYTENCDFYACNQCDLPIKTISDIVPLSGFHPKTKFKGYNMQDRKVLNPSTHVPNNQLPDNVNAKGYDEKRKEAQSNDKMPYGNLDLQKANQWKNT